MKKRTNLAPVWRGIRRGAFVVVEISMYSLPYIVNAAFLYVFFDALLLVK